MGLLSAEIGLLPQGSVRSERVVVFLTVIVRRGADILHLLHRRMEDRKETFTDL